MLRTSVIRQSNEGFSFLGTIRASVRMTSARISDFGLVDHALDFVFTRLRRMGGSRRRLLFFLIASAAFVSDRLASSNNNRRSPFTWDKEGKARP
jgi:hypothetical protein